MKRKVSAPIAILAILAVALIIGAFFVRFGAVLFESESSSLKFAIKNSFTDKVSEEEPRVCQGEDKSTEAYIEMFNKMDAGSRAAYFGYPAKDGIVCNVTSEYELVYKASKETTVNGAEIYERSVRKLTIFLRSKSTKKEYEVTSTQSGLGGYVLGGTIPNFYILMRDPEVADIYYGGVTDNGIYTQHVLMDLKTGQKILEYNTSNRSLTVRKGDRQWYINIAMEWKRHEQEALIRGVAVNEMIVYEINKKISAELGPKDYDGSIPARFYIAGSFWDEAEQLDDGTYSYDGLGDKVKFLENYSKITFPVSVHGQKLVNIQLSPDSYRKYERVDEELGSFTIDLEKDYRPGVFRYVSEPSPGYYSGLVTFDGIYEYKSSRAEGERKNMSCFYITEGRDQLPREIGDKRDPWVCFEGIGFKGQEQAVEYFVGNEIISDESICVIRGQARIVLDSYRINKESFDKIRLHNILSQSSPEIEYCKKEGE